MTYSIMDLDRGTWEETEITVIPQGLTQEQFDKWLAAQILKAVKK